MRTTALFPMIVLAAVAACHDGDGTGPSSAELAGTWRATSAEYVSATNPSLKVDLVAEGSMVTLVLAESHDFLLTEVPAGTAAQVTGGTWQASNDVMTLTPAGLTFAWVFQMDLTGDVLTLRGADTEYDFDGNGTREPARLNLTLVVLQ